MLKSMLTLGKNKEGATAIEFAFVAPVLFCFIFGIIEFGIVMATQSALEGATSQAARKYKALALSTSPGADAGEIHDIISSIGNGLIDPAKLDVTAKQISWGNAENFGDAEDIDDNDGFAGTTGDIVQYRAFYSYSVHTPFLATLLGGEDKVVPLVASTIVQNEPAIGGGGGI